VLIGFYFQVLFIKILFWLWVITDHLCRKHGQSENVRYLTSVWEIGQNSGMYPKCWEKIYREILFIIDFMLGQLQYLVT